MLQSILDKNIDHPLFNEACLAINDVLGTYLMNPVFSTLSNDINIQALKEHLHHLQSRSIDLYNQNIKF